MNAYQQIFAKQTEWAYNQSIKLIPSKITRGQPAYTPKLEQNLFEPLEPFARESFSQGDGNEINSGDGNPAKMQAVHSSSALGVNIFQYWQKIGQVHVIAAACGFCNKGTEVSQKIVFEDKYPVASRSFIPPNIDVVFWNKDSSKYKRYAVECKFSEAYNSRGHSGLKRKYMNLKGIWEDIPYTYNLADSISPIDNNFKHLHPAQLIKHILGLKRKFGKDSFRLLYLWYDAFGKEGATHRQEVEFFIKIVEKDDIKFHALTYQELITRLARDYRDKHPKYIKYLTERYL